MEDKMKIDTEGILDKAAARRLFVAVVITSFIGPFAGSGSYTGFGSGIWGFCRGAKLGGLWLFTWLGYVYSAYREAGRYLWQTAGIYHRFVAFCQYLSTGRLCHLGGHAECAEVSPRLCYVPHIWAWYGAAGFFP